MRLHELPKQRRVIVILSFALILLTFAFPYADYGYSAGFPRGQVIWEWKTTELIYEADDAVLVGRGSEFFGRGIIPCWNVTGKTILWKWVIAQAAIVAALGALAFAISPTSVSRRRELPESPASVDAGAGA